MKFILFFVLTITFSWWGNCQQDCNPNCLTNQLNISTGFNPITNTVIPSGSQDPFWLLTNAPTNNGPVSLNSPAFVIAKGSTFWADLAGSNYISAFANKTSNQPNVNPTVNPYTFQRCFCICGSSPGSSQKVNVTFDFEVLVDNRVDFFIDGTHISLISGSTVTVPSGIINTSVSNNFTSSHTVKGMVPLSPGRHCLEARLRNDDISSAMGLNIEGTISSPGQNIMREMCCNNRGYLTGYKYIDKNCNGKFDGRYNYDPGWVITAYNAATGASSTVTTDPNGYFSFNLTAGTYSLFESIKPGFYPSDPVGGIYNSITVTAGTVKTYYFGNCIGTQPQAGIFCCDSINNLIQNPCFEAGNTGFLSQYNYQGSIASNSVIPGHYSVPSNGLSVCNSWKFKDHTGCIKPGNSKVLVINGETTQPSNALNVVWEQNINGLIKDEQYKFCAYMKNLPACCFDIKPKIKVDVSSGASSGWTTINTGSMDCDWQLVSFNFTATGPIANLKIYLEETNKGDGNDLAIDDISLHRMAKIPVQLSVTNKSIGTACQITASINGIGSGDDIFSGKNCKHVWIIGKLGTISPPSFSGFPMLGGSMGNPTWGLTTNFPGFTCQAGQPYLIYLYVYDCDCMATGYSYQVSMDGSSMRVLSQEDETKLNQTVRDLIIQKQK
ncbi:MAG: hypothetical protein IPG87_15905 [Saprospiraceae bacterium]|nr:hypothetical protein [Candidatus Vicinibacter affinis]